MNAEDANHLEASYREFALKLGIPEAQRTTIPVLQPLVIDKLKKKRRSFVVLFDNANSYADIRDYIPADPALKGYVLVTTHIRHFFSTEGENLPIDTITITDKQALAIFRKNLSTSKSISRLSDEKMVGLLKFLKYHPRSIEEVACYLKMCDPRIPGNVRQKLENGGRVITKVLHLRIRKKQLMHYMNCV